ncbi:MAG TPA: prepilin-type N-terminal cleavage/methylation domain-containing protein [Candidatus Saccharimonadales bacterium]|nr:prepilin-type N-terminal cleavage/methylation domain-containing protein [Candidatus Saccharimonadales bacterium]
MLGGLRTPGQYPVARKVMQRSLKAPVPGFTIIEVMIVLAVTGLLFVSAAAMISGKENQTAFDQSIRQIQSQIQQVVNEVSVGFYPNLGNIQCNGAGGTVALTKAAGTAQGANAGCVFIGKAMQFQVGNASPEQFNVYSIAGLQKGGAGASESSSLSEAKPKVIAPSSAETTLPDSSTTDTLQNGLTTARMYYNNGAGDKDIGIVVFANGLAQFSATNGALLSGAQEVSLLAIDDNNVKSKLGMDKTSGVDIINSKLSTLTPSATMGVYLCFASGGTDQSGLITIGSNGRQLAVNLAIKSGKVC